MDPSLNTSTSSSFLGSLGDIATGYLAQRANMLLAEENGGNTVSYNPSQYAQTQSASSSLFSSPLVLVGGGLLLIVAVIFAFKAGK